LFNAQLEEQAGKEQRGDHQEKAEVVKYSPKSVAPWAASRACAFTGVTINPISRV